MKTIAVLSGKGGVGKSSITSSLAILLSKQRKIICADCDVDAPNLALLFGLKQEQFTEWEDISTNQKAVFDYEKCNGCRKCYYSCYFNAIDWDSVNNRPVLKEHACEGCGMAEVICPQNAIRLEDVINAKIGYAQTDRGFKIISSQLHPGESGSGKLVAKVKEKAELLAEDSEIMMVDSAAGVGCPVIASVSGSDYCILVVEPTPSGIYDMKRALEIVDHFNIDSGIVINKFDINEKYYEYIKEFADNKNINIIGKIPYNRSFVDSAVNMIPVIDNDAEIKNIFQNIVDLMLAKIYN